MQVSALCLLGTGQETVFPAASVRLGRASHMFELWQAIDAFCHTFRPPHSNLPGVGWWSMGERAGAW